MLVGPLPRQIEHRKLAENRAKLEGSIAIEEFERLAAYLCDTTGEIMVKLQFRKGKGQKTFVTGNCQASVNVQCQACLEPMTVEIGCGVRTFLLDSAEELATLRQSDDGIVCEGEVVKLVDLLEDDLMVSLPMVPRHDEGDCADPIAYEEDDSDVEDTYKPFAGLADLKEDLKRS
jgi:uncharacterized protein